MNYVQGGSNTDEELQYTMSCYVAPTVTWYGNVNSKNRTKLAPIINIATKLIGREQNQLSKIYIEALKRKAIQIYHDDAHPLNAAFHVLPSERRLKVPLAEKTSETDLSILQQF